MKAVTWFLVAGLAVALGSTIGVVQGRAQSQADLNVPVCVSDGLPLAVVTVARSAAEGAGLVVDTVPCAAEPSMITRPGFDPYRPELSLLPSEITRDEAVTPLARVVVRARPSGEDAARKADVTNNVVANRYRCEGRSCYPVGYEVYVSPDDPVEDVEQRLAAAAGLVKP